MYRVALLILFSTLSLGGKSIAQSLDFSGDVSLGVNSSDDRIGIAHVDAMLSFGLLSVAERRLSVELGTFAYFIKGDRPHETYAALAYDDRVRVGVVRPAYDLVLPSVFAATSPQVAEMRAEYTRALTTTEAMRFNAVPVGVSYTSDEGSARWAVSVHDVTKGEQFSAISAAFQRGDGRWVWSFAVEGVWNNWDDFQGINAKVGGGWRGDQWEIGLAYLYPDANARPDAFALAASYAQSKHLSLSAFADITQSAGDDAYGIAGVYDVSDADYFALSNTETGGVNEYHFTYTRRY